MTGCCSRLLLYRYVRDACGLSNLPTELAQPLPPHQQESCTGRWLPHRLGRVCRLQVLPQRRGSVFGVHPRLNPPAARYSLDVPTPNGSRVGLFPTAPQTNSAEERAHAPNEVEPTSLDGAPTGFARVRPPQCAPLPQRYQARRRSPRRTNLENGQIMGADAVLAAFGDPRDLPPPWGHVGPAFGVGQVPPQVLQQVFALQPSSYTLADALFCLFFAGSAAPEPAQQQQSR